jgi:hypothetical protein
MQKGTKCLSFTPSPLPEIRVKNSTLSKVSTTTTTTTTNKM